jgi:hypothetical protein
VGNDTSSVTGVAGGDASIRVELVVKRDCHLCEEALQVVGQVCESLNVGWRVLQIEADAALAIEYSEFVPVVLVDGHRHDFWRVDASRLRAALTS